MNLVCQISDSKVISTSTALMQFGCDAGARAVLKAESVRPTLTNEGPRCQS